MPNEELLQKIMMTVDEIIINKYFPNSSLEECPSPNVAKDWLFADITSVLTNSKDPAKAEREILHIIEMTGYARYILEQIPMNKVREEMALRKNLGEALRKVEKGSDLGEKLRYVLSEDDVIVLARLHKRNIERTKIEELLTSCKRYKERTMFEHKEYSFFFF